MTEMEEQSARATAAQLGLPFDSLTWVIDSAAMRFLPFAVGSRHDMVCFNANQKQAYVAFANPRDEAALEAARAAVSQHGKQLKVYVAPRKTIRDFYAAERLHRGTVFLFDAVEQVLARFGATLTGKEDAERIALLGRGLADHTVVVELLAQVARRAYNEGCTGFRLTAERLDQIRYPVYGMSESGECLMTLDGPAGVAIIEVVMRSRSRDPATGRFELELLVDGEYLRLDVVLATSEVPGLRDLEIRFEGSR